MNLQLKIDQLANCRQSGIFDPEPDGIGAETASVELFKVLGPKTRISWK